MRSDSITEFKAVADKTTQNIIDYDQQLNTWILVTLSILKDTSTEALGESWKATFNLTDVSIVLRLNFLLVNSFFSIGY